MTHRAFVAHNALLLCIVFFVLGGLSLAMGYEKIPGINHPWMAHVGGVLMLLSGTALMWRAEHEG